MLEGDLYYAQVRRCGKPNCACAHDDSQRHGPYWYVREASGRVRYVGRELPDSVLWTLAECERLRSQVVERRQQLVDQAAALARLARGEVLASGDRGILRGLGFGSCLLSDYAGQAVGSDFQQSFLSDVPGYFVPGNGGN